MRRSLHHCEQQLIAPHRAMPARVHLRRACTHYFPTGRACHAAARIEPALPPAPVRSCASAQAAFGRCAIACSGN